MRNLLCLFLTFFPLTAWGQQVIEPGSDSAAARAALFANRYREAIDLYTKITAAHPEDGDAWCELVRAQLRDHHPHDASIAGASALQKAPNTAGAETAAALAAYRDGELPSAENHLHAALKIQPDYPEALKGLARIYYSTGLNRTARDFQLRAYTKSPDDPELISVHLNSLKPAERLAALEEMLAKMDPASEAARNLRVRIANDKALGSRRVRRMTSPYVQTTVPLALLMHSVTRARGIGLQMRVNGKHTFRLLLDTGASGIALSPKAVEKAELEELGAEKGEMKGIGDKGAQSTSLWLASEVKIGDVVFADYPIAIFRSAQNSDFDGLIGADVFAAFLVQMDFRKPVMTLIPRPEGIGKADGPTDRKKELAEGFRRVYQFANHLVVPTQVNEKRNTLFLIDSGASVNLIDTAVGKSVAWMGGTNTKVEGIQGRVDKTMVANGITLAFAGFRQDNAGVLSIDMERTSEPMGVALGGILGMPVLENLVMTVDYRESAVKMEMNRR